MIPVNSQRSTNYCCEFFKNENDILRHNKKRSFVDAENSLPVVYFATYILSHLNDLLKKKLIFCRPQANKKFCLSDQRFHFSITFALPCSNFVFLFSFPQKLYLFFFSLPIGFQTSI